MARITFSKNDLFKWMYNDGRNLSQQELTELCWNVLNGSLTSDQREQLLNMDIRYATASDPETRLQSVSDILTTEAPFGSFGVEGIHESMPSGTVVLSYINLGDTYDQTLVLDKTLGQNVFKLIDWGSVYEEWQSEFGGGMEESKKVKNVKVVAEQKNTKHYRKELVQSLTQVQESIRTTTDPEKLNQLLEVAAQLDESISVDINAVLKGYLAAALWSSSAEIEPFTDRSFDDNGYTIFDIDGQSTSKAKQDCARFVTLAGDALDGVPSEFIGHEFWLSRNGHGSGFFDSDYVEDQETRDKLQQMAKSFGEKDMYLGDDGKIYIS